MADVDEEDSSTFADAEEAADAVDECIRRISYYQGSKMCHKGLGFDGTEHIDGFRRCFYTVDVEGEVNKIVRIVEQMAELSIREKSADPLRDMSDYLYDMWNNFEQKKGLEVDKSCTLEHFDTEDENASWMLRAIRSTLLECWDDAFNQLATQGHLKSNDVDWIIRTDYHDTFVPAQIKKNASPMAKALALGTRNVLLTDSGATIGRFIARIQSVPQAQRADEIRSLIMVAAPKITDTPCSLVGKYVVQRRWSAGSNAIGKIMRTSGDTTANGKINESTTWDIEWRLPTSDSDGLDFDMCTKEEESLSVSFEQLLNFVHMPRWKSGKEECGKDKPFMLCAGSHCIDSQKVLAVKKFSDLFWGPDAIADSTTANYVVNEINAWNGQDRLTREMYGHMARRGEYAESALNRARELLWKCIPYLVDKVLLEIWDNVVLLQSRTGQEKAHAERVAKIALNFGKALDMGIIPRLSAWATDECSDVEMDDMQYTKGEEMLNEIWCEVADRYFDRYDDGDDEDEYGFVSRPDEMFEMERPKERDVFGSDFRIRKEANMDEDAYWSNFGAPIRSWFRIASVAIQNCPDAALLDSSKVNKRKRNQNQKETLQEQIASKKVAFVTEWRDAVVQKLRSADILDSDGNGLGMTGEGFADATLALCAALDRCGICKPHEWVILTSMFSALRDGPKGLSFYFFGKELGNKTQNA